MKLIALATASLAFLSSFAHAGGSESLRKALRLAGIDELPQQQAKVKGAAIVPSNAKNSPALARGDIETDIPSVERARLPEQKLLRAGGKSSRTIVK